ncbi:HAMP domain-containing histidine kinase, partial [Akkermansiaceae bacterium]|nr:HAMP domain-containing histidine kinase [Akkermansiaceae bacterium]
MNRSWVIWSVLLACAVVIFCTMAWMTNGVIRSEEDRLLAQAQAQVSERVGLALSRMDTIGAALLVVENQRPPLHYEAFFSPEDIFTAQARNLKNTSLLQASPLLTEENDVVKLHFEIRKDRSIHSPQVPSQDRKALASEFGVDEEELGKRRGVFDQLVHLLTNRQAPQMASMCRAVHGSPGASMPSADALALGNAWVENNWGIVPQTANAQVEYNNALQTTEQAKRSAVVSKEVTKASNRSLKKTKQEVSKAPSTIEREELASMTPFQPVWIEGELFLVRQVQGSRSSKYQGVWLSHEKLEAELTEQLPEELAGASLVAVSEKEDDPMRLVTLPWSLDAPALVLPPLAMSNPIYKTLSFAWIAALLSLLALGFLLRAVIKLSERRAAFVSSVTHELRTPLTTFRLYSEMLADGMVPDDEKKQEYLKTMQSESERLNHLVENVLSYARIERGNARSHFETLQAEDLVERIRPVLQRRVDQEDASLSISLEDGLGSLETDVTAVEQILFNLIDNACKYGLPESGGGHIKLGAVRTKRGLTFEVSDEGRGIATHERRRLFRAFHKSAQDAAHSKP